MSKKPRRITYDTHASPRDRLLKREFRLVAAGVGKCRFEIRGEIRLRETHKKKKKRLLNGRSIGEEDTLRDGKIKLFKDEYDT